MLCLVNTDFLLNTNSSSKFFYHFGYVVSKCMLLFEVCFLHPTSLIEKKSGQDTVIGLPCAFFQQDSISNFLKNFNVKYKSQIQGQLLTTLYLLTYMYL